MAPSKGHTPAVMITGVSSGIGHAIARFLSEKDYRVFGSVRKTVDAERLSAEFESNFSPLVLDVRDHATVDTASAQVRSVIGDQPLAALVNNAGLALFGPMECIDDGAFEDIMRVNLLGTRNVTNAFLPLLRPAEALGKQDGQPVRGPGKIINISSLSGILNTPMNGAYCVSKHAMESLGEIYRRELLSAGIDVVAIRSGPIRSEIWRKNLQPDPQFDGTAYEALATSAQRIMRDAQADALPAEVIAQLVLDIIEGRRRRTAYEVGRGAIMARVLASSLLPKRLADRLVDWGLRRSAG